MNPQDVITKNRETIVAELNLGHLSGEEQDQVLDILGEALMRRMIAKVIELLPEDKKQEFEQLFTAENTTAVEALIAAHIPNAQEVLMQEVRTGIDEYKKRVNERAAEDAGEASAAGVPTM